MSRPTRARAVSVRMFSSSTQPCRRLRFRRPSTRSWRHSKWPTPCVASKAGGLGSYCFFRVNPAIHATHSFEVPVTNGIKLHDLLTVSLGGVGVIDHVVNDFGAAAQGAATIPVNVVSYPPGT